MNKKYYRWLVDIGLILVVLTAIRFWVQRDIISGSVPNISSYMINGKYFDLYKSKPRPVLLHFWATWCPVCKLEQSSIDDISKDYSVVTIALQSGDSKELNKFMSEEKLSFNVIDDNNGMISRQFNIKGVPVSLIVNKNNKIEFVEAGYTSELGLRLRLWWAGLN